MTDLLHGGNKTDRQVSFSTQLNWLQGYEGIITARDVKDTLYVGLAQQYGGDGKNWSPEHVLLAALSGSFMTTCMSYAGKMDVEITHMDCDASAQVVLEAEHYGISRINLWPRVYIKQPADREKAGQILLKAQQYCIIGQALKEPVIYHGQVLHDPHAEKYKEPGKKRHYYAPMEAKEIGDRLGMDWNLFRLEEFRRGLEVEMEHATDIAESNIHNDPFTMAKIAMNHLMQIPDYYTRLDAMEKAATTP
jgi:organic hydroperoxide reductase OsmC/OhrA